MALKPKQQKFVEEYVRTGNATQAYVAAGYKGRGKSARNAASKMLANVGIAAAVAAGQVARAAAVAERTGVDAAYVVSRLVIEAEREDNNATHMGRIAALRLLGEHVGLFGDVATVRKLLELERGLDEMDGEGGTAPAGDDGSPVAGKIG
jgi:phage terminase small subunit